MPSPYTTTKRCRGHSCPYGPTQVKLGANRNLDPLASTRRARLNQTGSRSGSVRVAVCVSGLVRSWRITHLCPFSLAAVDNGSVDHFVAAGLSVDRERFEVQRLLPTGFPAEHLHFYLRDDYTSQRTKAKGVATGVTDSFQGFPMSYGNLLSWRLALAAEERGGFEYDWVVRTRPDVLTRFQVILGPPPTAEQIYVSRLGGCNEKAVSGQREPYACCNDVFAVLTRTAASAYYVDYYESFLSRDFAPAPGHGRTWGKRAVCAECRLGHTLRKIGVEFHLLPRPVNILRVKDANHRNLPAWSPESLRDLRSWRNSGRFRLPEVMAPERNDEPVNHTCPARYSNSNNHCLSCVDHGSCAANTYYQAPRTRFSK